MPKKKANPAEQPDTLDEKAVDAALEAQDEDKKPEPAFLGKDLVDDATSQELLAVNEHTTGHDLTDQDVFEHRAGTKVMEQKEIDELVNETSFTYRFKTNRERSAAKATAKKDLAAAQAKFEVRFVEGFRGDSDGALVFGGFGFAESLFGLHPNRLLLFPLLFRGIDFGSIGDGDIFRNRLIELLLGFFALDSFWSSIEFRLRSIEIFLRGSLGSITFTVRFETICKGGLVD